MIKSNNPAASSGNPPAASNSPAARSPHRAIKPLSELKISPAPWRVDKTGELRDVGDVIGDYFSDVIIRHERRKKVIATPNRHFDDWEANARLIAAAPTLYHVAWCFDRLCNEGRVDVKNPFVYEVWRQCRAVLAEAAGEEVSDE